MSKLQNNFTTQEQSKRLLELGVPVDSADCYNTTKHIGKIPDGATYQDVWKMSIWRNENGIHIEMYPCWSVGRLIEICLLVFERHYFAPKAIKITTASLYGAGLIEDCVRKLEELHESYIVDFSKLEE